MTLSVLGPEDTGSPALRGSQALTALCRSCFSGKQVGGGGSQKSREYSQSLLGEQVLFLGNRASPQPLACSWKGVHSSELPMPEAPTGSPCKMGVLTVPWLRLWRGERAGGLRILQGLLQDENASPLFRDHQDFQGGNGRARDSAFLSMGPCGPAPP